MVPAPPIQPAARSRTIRVTWILTGILAFFPIVSLWVIPWLPSDSFDWLTLTEPGTTAWIAVFVLGSIGCVVLLVGQLLAFQNRKVAINARLWATLAVVLVWALWGYWFYATTASKTVRAATPSHSVLLTWQASTSVVAGYHVYRSRTPNQFNDPPLNALPIPETRYIDTAVEDGVTYYYAVRAVDGKNNLSALSNVVPAPIP